MAETSKPKKRVQLGPPLSLTNEQLDELAEVTPADIEKAKALWHAKAPEEFKTLLDAQRIEEEKP